MKLRSRLRLLWIAITLVAAALSFLAAQILGRDPTKAALVLLLPLAASLLALQVLLVRRAQGRLTRALAHGNLVELRRELADLADFFGNRPEVRELLRLQQAQLLVVEERYAEARTVLESLDHASLGEERLPLVQTQLAWCLAHLGESHAAIDLSRAVLGRLGDEPRAQAFAAQGTLGAAYVLAAEPAQAVPMLEQALAAPTQPPLLEAAYAFYLGEALTALGHREQAATAYSRARRAAPESPFGHRAATRLPTG